jgi:hypothetical protein
MCLDLCHASNSSNFCPKLMTATLPRPCNISSRKSAKSLLRICVLIHPYIMR